MTAPTSTTHQATSDDSPDTARPRNVSAHPVLDIRDVSVAFPGDGENPTLSEVSLSLHPGRIHGLVGQSGSGKSLLASAAIGLLPDTATLSSGNIVLRDEENDTSIDVASAPERRLVEVRGRRIGMIFQNPLSSLDPTLTVESHFSRIARLRESEDTGQVRTWLERVGFEDPDTVLSSYPHQLSGGMRQRVVVALVCFSRPEVIIADEPTTALDTVVQKQVLDLLRSIVDETGVALLLITHDFDVIRHLTDDVTVLRSGNVVESRLTRQVISEPSDPYTRALLAAVPSIDRPLSRNIDHDAEVDAVLSAQGLTKDYGAGGTGGGRKRTHRVVDHVDLTIRRGETYAVIGRSGSGKSTLARLLGELIERSDGTLQRPDRRSVQYVFQDPTSSLNPVKNVGRQIARPLRRFGLPSGKDAVVAALESVGLDATFAARYPLGLSGGEAQRVCLARALALDPDVLILDEPTSALDVLTQREIVDLLLDIQEKRGLTCVFIAHSLGLVTWVADRVGVMKDGQLVDEFPVTDLQAPSRSDAVKELLDANLSSKEK